MLIGYARCSTGGQKLDLQVDALKQAGCEKLFTEVASGSKASRDQLGETLNHLRAGDTLVVWKLDRLGRSLRHLIDVVTSLEASSIAFRSLQENIDTTTSGGKLFFHMFGALAEFERDIIRERTKAGLASARARGRLGGRPSVMNDRKVKVARSLYDANTPVLEICSTLRVSKATLYRFLPKRPTVEAAPIMPKEWKRAEVRDQRNQKKSR